jgi:hypothetical protein
MGQVQLQPDNEKTLFVQTGIEWTCQATNRENEERLNKQAERLCVTMAPCLIKIRRLRNLVNVTVRGLPRDGSVFDPIFRAKTQRK